MKAVLGIITVIAIGSIGLSIYKMVNDGKKNSKKKVRR